MTDIEDDGYASPDELLVGDLDLDGQDVTLPSGKKVRIRGLSRHELMFNGKGTDDNPLLLEVRNIKSCMVKPALTIKQVEAWQRQSSAGGDFKFITEQIRDLSGLREGADKSGLRGDGDDEPGV
jgi:hypothetical protein